MNKLFFALLILAFFVFEVKSNWDDNIPPEILEKMPKFIIYLHDYGLWDTFLAMLREYDTDFVISWCMNYGTYEECKLFIEDYLDY